MNKKGFTLVELLAVIVVLGVIMTIASSLVFEQRKKANIEMAKKLEETIKSFGPDVYLNEKRKDVTYDLNNLKDYGLKTSDIKNPNGNGNCSGYLEITEDIEFVGHICCPGLYETGSDEVPETCN